MAALALAIQRTNCWVNGSADPFGHSQRANPVASRLNVGSLQPAG